MLSLATLLTTGAFALFAAVLVWLVLRTRVAVLVRAQIRPRTGV